MQLALTDTLYRSSDPYASSSHQNGLVEGTTSAFQNAVTSSLIESNVTGVVQRDVQLKFIRMG